MKHHLFFSAVTASILVSQVSAGTMGTAMSPKDPTWVGSVSGGAVWAKAGETQTFYLAPDIEKTYSANKSTNALASGELFLGIQKLLSSQWVGQLGLAATTTSNAKLQGEIWDDADPQFNNYSYQYKVKHTGAAVKAKLLLDRGGCIIPWVSGSVGAGFNRAYEFTNTPLIFEAVPNTNFSSHTTTAFTYSVGAGVQKALSSHWQIGVGYEFADWGKSELAPAPGQTLNSGLALNHLYTNGVLLNITYVA